MIVTCKGDNPDVKMLLANIMLFRPFGIGVYVKE